MTAGTGETLGEHLQLAPLDLDLERVAAFLRQEPPSPGVTARPNLSALSGTGHRHLPSVLTLCGAYAGQHSTDVGPASHAAIVAAAAAEILHADPRPDSRLGDASLLATASRMGGLASCLPAEQVEQLAVAGHELGLAFGLVDALRSGQVSDMPEHTEDEEYPDLQIRVEDLAREHVLRSLVALTPPQFHPAAVEALGRLGDLALVPIAGPACIGAPTRTVGWPTSAFELAAPA